VAVIDVLMPTRSGIECAHLQERYLKARVILISRSIFEDKRPQARLGEGTLASRLQGEIIFR